MRHAKPSKAWFRVSDARFYITPGTYTEASLSRAVRAAPSMRAMLSRTGSLGLAVDTVHGAFFGAVTVRAAALCARDAAYTTMAL